MDAHGHDNPLLNWDKPERKRLSCTDPPDFFPTIFTAFLSLFSSYFFFRNNQNACTNNKPLSSINLLFCSTINMARRIDMRCVKRDWIIDVQGVALLNRTPNSTSVSGNCLEVANAHLDSTTSTSDAAEAHHGFLGGLVGQAEETLRQA